MSPELLGEPQKKCATFFVAFLHEDSSEKEGQGGMKEGETPNPPRSPFPDARNLFNFPAICHKSCR